MKLNEFDTVIIGTIVKDGGQGDGGGTGSVRVSAATPGREGA